MRPTTWIWMAAMTCGLVMGCGNRLSPAETCETLVSQAETCGTYRPGSFGGTDRDSDIARCTQNVMLFNDECQGYASNLARCITRGCAAADLEPCRVMLTEYNMRCAP